MSAKPSMETCNSRSLPAYDEPGNQSFGGHFLDKVDHIIFNRSYSPADVSFVPKFTRVGLPWPPSRKIFLCASGGRELQGEESQNDHRLGPLRFFCQPQGRCRHGQHRRRIASGFVFLLREDVEETERLKITKGRLRPETRADTPAWSIICVYELPVDVRVCQAMQGDNEERS